MKRCSALLRKGLARSLLGQFGSAENKMDRRTKMLTLRRVLLVGVLLAIGAELTFFVTKATVFCVGSKTLAFDHGRCGSLRNRSTSAVAFSGCNVSSSWIRQQNSSRLFAIKPKKVKNINCKALFNGDKYELRKAKRLTLPSTTKNSTSTTTRDLDVDLTNRASDCEHYVTDRGYVTSKLTEREADFPIAFSLVMYKDALQVEHLLRAIYRPQNIYCIQIDASSARHVTKAIETVAQCFPNVFVSDAKINIEWGKVTVLQADLTCLEQLLNRSNKWRYFINLTGQEFPLKTNAELVEILRALNGASNVIGSRKNSDRYNRRYNKTGPPPHGFKPATGSLHVVLSRPFAQFAIHDQRARDYLSWASNNVTIPDETFFQTLYLTPSLNISGAYKYPELKKKSVNAIHRYKEWLYCRGKMSHEICILGVDYLPALARSRALFANKFHWNHERVSLQCMDELLYNRTRDEYLGTATFNATWYSKLDFVVNKI